MRSPLASPQARRRSSRSRRSRFAAARRDRCARVCSALWQRAATARDAARGSGFAFGCGLFGAGVSWVYIALETFGGMPAPVAVFGTAGFVALPRAVARARRLGRGRAARRAGIAGAAPRAAAARGRLRMAARLRLHRLPVARRGLYASCCPDGALPLAGFAPGRRRVPGVARGRALRGRASPASSLRWRSAQPRARRRVPRGHRACSSARARLLTRIEWTTPHGAPVAVSLVQGNVSQAEKFDPDFRPRNYELYENLVRAGQGTHRRAAGERVSAVRRRDPGVGLPAARRRGARARRRVLVGLFAAEPPLEPGEGERIYNSVVSIGDAPPQLYRKHHLVPFGESIPLKPLVGLVHQPGARASRSPTRPPGPPISRRSTPRARSSPSTSATRTCSAPSSLPRRATATLLVNVTNDAWYGRSIAARQHNQIAAMRALETGPPDAARDQHRHHVGDRARRPRARAHCRGSTQGILETEIAGRTGDTPYLRVRRLARRSRRSCSLVPCALAGVVAVGAADARASGENP